MTTTTIEEPNVTVLQTKQEVQEASTGACRAFLDSLYALSGGAYKLTSKAVARWWPDADIDRVMNRHG